LVVVVVLAEAEVIFPQDLSLDEVVDHPLSLGAVVVLPHESKAEVVGAVKAPEFVDGGANDEDEVFVAGADEKPENAFVVVGVEKEGKLFDMEVVPVLVVVVVVVFVVDGAVIEDHGSDVKSTNPPIEEVEEPVFPAPPAPAAPVELEVLAHGSSKDEKLRPVVGPVDVNPLTPIPPPELVVGVKLLSNCNPEEPDFVCAAGPVKEGVLPAVILLVFEFERLNVEPHFE
jgi:hypothetical protein